MKEHFLKLFSKVATLCLIALLSVFSFVPAAAEELNTNLTTNETFISNTGVIYYYHDFDLLQVEHDSNTSYTSSDHYTNVYLDTSTEGLIQQYSGFNNAYIVYWPDGVNSYYQNYACMTFERFESLLADGTFNKSYGTNHISYNITNGTYGWDKYCSTDMSTLFKLGYKRYMVSLGTMHFRSIDNITTGTDHTSNLYLVYLPEEEIDSVLSSSITNLTSTGTYVIRENFTISYKPQYTSYELVGGSFDINLPFNLTGFNLESTNSSNYINGSRLICTFNGELPIIKLHHDDIYVSNNNYVQSILNTSSWGQITSANINEINITYKTGNFFKDAFNFIGLKLDNLITAITNMSISVQVTQNIENIEGQPWWSYILNAITDLFTSITELIGNALNTAINGLFDLVDSLSVNVLDFISDIIDKFNDLIETIDFDNNSNINLDTDTYGSLLAVPKYLLQKFFDIGLGYLLVVPIVLGIIFKVV